METTGSQLFVYFSCPQAVKGEPGKTKSSSVNHNPLVLCVLFQEQCSYRTLQQEGWKNGVGVTEGKEKHGDSLLSVRLGCHLLEVVIRKLEITLSSLAFLAFPLNVYKQNKIICTTALERSTVIWRDPETSGNTLSFTIAYQQPENYRFSWRVILLHLDKIRLLPLPVLLLH